MLRIVLIRPGSTDYDQQRRIQGTLDIPLCDEGRAQVARAVEPLRAEKIELIYSSSCEAATETAELLAQALGVKTKTLDKLHNQEFGLWQGMLIDDVKTKQPRVYRQWQDQPDTICPPDGEMLSEVRERAQATLAKLHKKHREGVIGLVAPEPLASVLRTLINAGPIGDLWNPGPCCGWQSLSFEPAALRN